MLLSAALAAPVTGADIRSAAPLAYDTSAYELALRPDPAPWDRAALERELRERIARQTSRRELDVYYYRIGHTLAFPLPLGHRPARADLPPGIATMAYPWMIWLSWELEERWQILHHAWRQGNDREAGWQLQRELAALSTWDRIIENNDQPGLATAHIAGCLALALANREGWDPALLKQATAAADALIERDVWPWFLRQWADDKPYDHRRLVNIPVITLARAAQLARLRKSPRAEPMERRMIEVLRTWARFRTGTEHHTEGTTYDGYLMDSVTGWLAALPQRTELQRECRDAFRSLLDQWIHLTLPGRMDLHAPIGDVEPEMPFWTVVVARFGAWYGWTDSLWLLTRVPLERLPAATLLSVLNDNLPAAPTAGAPVAAAREHPHAVSLRTSWNATEPAAFASISRNPMTHLHADAGQVVLGWQGRFWISDPGYQQYRPGEEREYTIGPQAHNAPVISGTIQKSHAAKLLGLETLADRRQRAQVDLTACYPGLPRGAKVRRDVWLVPAENAAVIVRDEFEGLAADAEIGTQWLGGHHLAWAFVEGWARLSDGQRAVWIGAAGERIVAAELARHPGTRGPLAIAHKSRLTAGAGVRWWVFQCDSAGGWVPPKIDMGAGGLTVTAGRPGAPAVTFGP